MLRSLAVAVMHNLEGGGPATPPTRYVHQSLSQTCSYLPKGSFQSMSELVCIITVKTAPFQGDESVKQNTRALKINHLNGKPCQCYHFHLCLN